VKKFCLIAILILIPPALLHAQTNAVPRAQTLITSHSADFDMNTRTAIYRGDVRVDEPQMKLSCEWLKATLPESGGRINHIVCETNVVIDYVDEKGETNHITSDKAVYDFNVENSVTNETITFTGNPKIENAQSIVTAEPIVWDRANGKFYFTNQKMIFKQGINMMRAETNSPAK